LTHIDELVNHSLRTRQTIWQNLGKYSHRNSKCRNAQNHRNSKFHFRVQRPENYSFFCAKHSSPTSAPTLTSANNSLGPA